MDFRNDCGEAISSCTSSLNREQLRILSEADAILQDIEVDLVLAETDEKWEAIRDRAIRELDELGEPQVFKAYQKMWNDAADVIVPMVRQMQIKNGVTPYTPEEYADHSGDETVEAPAAPEESADSPGDGTVEAPAAPETSADTPRDGMEGQEP